MKRLIALTLLIMTSGCILGDPPDYYIGHYPHQYNTQSFQHNNPYYRPYYGSHYYSPYNNRGHDRYTTSNTHMYRDNDYNFLSYPTSR